MEKGSKEVSLPAELYNWLGEKARTEGFGSVDDYAIFVLEEAFKKERQGEKGTLSKEDEEEVVKRLGALGYLD
ncbi:hypothetical protein ES703_41042 [subsurface metagenome]